MRTPAWVPWVYLGPAVAVMAAACLYPLLSALQLGFYDWSMGTPWGEAKWVGMDAFSRAFQDPAVWRSLRTTLLFAAVCVTAEMVLGIALALALEGQVRGMAVFRTLFILPMMIAPIAVGLTWRYLFDAQFGLINAILAVFGSAPIGWLAQENTAFIAITLLMRLIDAFRVLEVIYILTFGGPGDSTEILSLHIYKTAFVSQRMGSAAAISLLLLMVVVILSWFALRLSNPLKDEER